jgi:hypothetical protein
MIATGHHASALQTVARQEGMVPLREYGWTKVIAGLTSTEEVTAVTEAPSVEYLEREGISMDDTSRDSLWNTVKPSLRAA